MQFKIFFFLTFLVGTIGNTWAQNVPKNIILEHFTNTRCSICASRNPALLQNLASRPQVLHLSIHPSSPYANCFLSQRNAVTNDARTNFYGIYGGTPRIVINGVVQSPSVNFGSATLFAPFEQDSTAFTLDLRISREGSDSVSYTIKIVKTAFDTLTNAVLFSGIAQDTVFGNGGNGEQAHQQVLVAGRQQVVSLPMQIGDSVVLTNRFANRPSWEFSRLLAMAVLQHNASKALIQAAKSNLLETGLTASSPQWQLQSDIQLYPNPNKGIVKTNLEAPFRYQLHDLQGAVLQEGLAIEGEIRLGEGLLNGLYLLRLTTTDGAAFAQKLLLAR